MSFLKFLTKVTNGTCPNCGKTKIFTSNGNPFLFKMPKMNHECNNCGYSFYRETGFYTGAMYISYAVTVAEMVAVIVLGLIFKLSPIQMFIGIVLIAFLFSAFNYKISRLIWLNIFHKKE